MDGKKYLFKRHTNSKEKVASELLWLEDLHMNTSLKIQTPVKNKQNKLVTAIFDEENRKMRFGRYKTG